MTWVLTIWGIALLAYAFFYCWYVGFRRRGEQDRDNFNMAMGWRKDNWNISVWGKNLTDEEYANQTASQRIPSRIIKTHKYLEFL
jgi:outer membrane receptor protein involved in Fe transport